MKTKMLHFAAALSAAALLCPVALAGPGHPVKRQTSGPATRGDCCVKQTSCKGIACCGTKMKSDTAPGGRGSRSSFKKVRTCTSSCPVADSDKAAVCRMGAKQ